MTTVLLFNTKQIFSSFSVCFSVSVMLSPLMSFSLSVFIYVCLSISDRQFISFQLFYSEEIFNLSLYRSFYVSFFSFFCLSVFPSFCLSVFLSISLSFCLSLCCQFELVTICFLCHIVSFFSFFLFLLFYLSVSLLLTLSIFFLFISLSHRKDSTLVFSFSACPQKGMSICKSVLFIYVSLSCSFSLCIF